MHPEVSQIAVRKMPRFSPSARRPATLALAAFCLVGMLLSPLQAQTSALGGFRDNGTAGGRAARTENPALMLNRDRARQLGTLDDQNKRLEQQRVERNRELTQPCPSSTNPGCRDVKDDSLDPK